MCLAAKKTKKHETSNVVTHSIKTFKLVHILENLKNKTKVSLKALLQKEHCLALTRWPGISPFRSPHPRIPFPKMGTLKKVILKDPPALTAS